MSTGYSKLLLAYAIAVNGYAPEDSGLPGAVSDGQPALSDQNG
jgi:hypothetical protein